METLHSLLKKVFGYDTFRKGQEEIIQSILEGRDVMAVLPTGGGKSLCFQLPTLFLSGVTLVISPLISLMKDQVDGLKKMGLAAAAWNSATSQSQASEILNLALCDQLKLLYVAPERLEMEDFVSFLGRVNISLVVVDEAHCISQWGHDFRPSYRKISSALGKLPQRPPIAAFTATATEQVREDIITLMELQAPKVVITGFDRPNLYFDVVHLAKKQRKEWIVQYIRHHSDDSGIIYCSTRKEVEELFLSLQNQRISVNFYHAGLSDQERAQAQEDFLYDRVQVMVATNAFGMGIDKSNVRFVIHHSLPKSIESYWQEAGRAGRDGIQAECILLYAPGDLQLQRVLIENGERTEEQKLLEWGLLQKMAHYADEAQCYRRYLLQYFGEEGPEHCEHCGCCSSGQDLDVTRPAQMALSCVHRMGQRYGAALIADVLLGRDTARIRELGLSSLSTYGLMKGLAPNQVVSFIGSLVCDGLLREEEGKFPVLSLTPLAVPVLKGEKTLLHRLAPPRKRKTEAAEPKEVQKKPHQSANNLALTESEQMLFQQLRQLRARLASEANVPPYIIFSDLSLRQMATQRPACKEDFLKISGVGEKKLELYAQDFLEEICHFQTENGSGDFATSSVGQPQIQNSEIPFIQCEKFRSEIPESGGLSQALAPLLYQLAQQQVEFLLSHLPGISADMVLEAVRHLLNL